MGVEGGQSLAEVGGARSAEVEGELLEAVVGEKPVAEREEQ